VPAVSAATLFAPVQSQTAFEETFERLGTAIKLGLLAPGAQLPAERELCRMLEVSRSTLRQALLALTQTGHVRAARGRGGGTFVADELPPAEPPSTDVLACWREVCDMRLATELAVAALAAERAEPDHLPPIRKLVERMRDPAVPFSEFRRLDVTFHLGLAELTQSRRLLVASTETQSAMSGLISYIAHPAEVLGHSNDQHARLLACIEHGDRDAAMSTMAEHVLGTVHVLAGLLPG
jgi:DNA-binding FadR family transcriptional regulator